MTTFQLLVADGIDVADVPRCREVIVKMSYHANAQEETLTCETMSMAEWLDAVGMELKKSEGSRT
jgi:hypothetical protein